MYKQFYGVGGGNSSVAPLGTLGFKCCCSSLREANLNTVFSDQQWPGLYIQDNLPERGHGVFAATDIDSL